MTSNPMAPKAKKGGGGGGRTFRETPTEAHVAALEWSRRRLAALLEGAHRPGLVAAEV